MAKYLIDYECSLYFTEYIEADSYDEACCIANKLLAAPAEYGATYGVRTSEYDDRMIEGFAHFPISPENIDLLDVEEVPESTEVTLTAEDIKHYLKED